jgi:hypothetical protein
MADKAEYYHPKDKPPGNADYDPIIGHPSMKGRRWKIDWFGSGKELPKVADRHMVDMKGTRVLSAGAETVGEELEVFTYKDHAKAMIQ